jgi:ABC-type multidrug transport system ATPase subunit
VTYFFGRCKDTNLVNLLSMIGVEHLYKNFKQPNGLLKKAFMSAALDDINFSLEEGAVLMVLGTKASGKSTLLRILAAMQFPDKGTVEIMGLNLDKQAVEIRKKIGYFSYEQSYFDNLTIKEQLFYFANLKGLKSSEIAVKIDSLMQKWDLKPNKKTSLVSIEEKLRLGIAQTMLNDPKLIILDEPSFGLDIFGAKPILDLVAEAKLSGTTVVYAGSNLSKTEFFGDKIIILDRGRMIYADTMTEFKNKYGNSPTEGYLQILNENLKTV